MVLVLKRIFSETKYVSILNADNNFDEEDPNATILISKKTSTNVKNRF